jgi:hypothetical protein
MIVKETRTYELDDSIGMLILELNQKGYVTTFCCGGHPNGAYIAFDRWTSIMLDMEIFGGLKNHGLTVSNHPNNWIVDRDEFCDLYYKQFIIRRKFTDEEYLTNTDEQLTNMVVQELYEWVDMLPDNSRETINNTYEIIKL